MHQIYFGSIFLAFWDIISHAGPHITRNNHKLSACLSSLSVLRREKKKSPETKTEKSEEPTEEKPLFYTLNEYLKNSKLFGFLTSFEQKCWYLYLSQAWAVDELLICLGLHWEPLGSSLKREPKYVSNYFASIIPLLLIPETIHKFLCIELKLCTIPHKIKSSYIVWWLKELPQQAVWTA